jgi:type I restriction enzyme, S subunit
MSSSTKTMATKEDGKSTIVPKLRFPEFRGTKGWREMTFGELLDGIIDFRGRTPVKLGMEWGNGNITSLSANNVKNGFIDYKAECNLGSEELYQRWMGDVSLEKNDIVFTMEAPLGNALLLPDSRKYILSQRVVAFKTTSHIVNPFLLQLIWSEGFQDAISELSSGSTAKGINQKALKTVPVKVPHPKEQQKIAECLSSVDEVIAAQARKVDALKTHKKGLMQLLFPREGETQPRLRLPEFQGTGKWNKIALSQAATFYNGRAYKQEELLESGKYPVLRVGNFFTSTSWYHSDLELDETKYCENGDLLYAWSASFGPRIWRGDKSIYHYHIWKVIEQQGIDKQFLFITLENETENMKAKTTNGLGIMHITKGAIENWESTFPTIAEQRKIAGCLMTLDKTITAEIEKLDALKNHKKGLMQQLFPSSDVIRS